MWNPRLSRLLLHFQATLDDNVTNISVKGELNAKAKLLLFESIGIVD